jgi:hypothetical protein
VAAAADGGGGVFSSALLLRPRLIVISRDLLWLSCSLSSKADFQP